MHTWTIELTPASHRQFNDVLSLNQNKTTGHFRRWFGGLAGEIYLGIKSGLDLAIARPQPLDKTQAQHILIQAAMVQQQCMHHYRVYQDLKAHDLKDLALHDLLLFIRMANYHPSYQDLGEFQQHSHVIESNEHLKTLINELNSKQLIQCIKVNNKRFYDKNPYPHCHLLDTETGLISDYDCHLNVSHSHRFKRIPHKKMAC
ncbi:hypothetical protein [Marinicella gelatinilytica]|uniref:hypothetical protein n=1 Tax=Marinicella gelatinilytica TaxID=2996017 RepID=UPI00226098F6|nr:hypothetical protein [Marinicella gelatinilytica]MCX7545138.1 hypothetical protein [Marinicella gelatinilytica]